MDEKLSKKDLQAKLGDMTKDAIDDEWAKMLKAAPKEVREELGRDEWASVRHAMANASKEALARLITAWSTMLCANAEVTPFAHVLSSTVRCNTAHLQLGAREASRCAMFYMVKYLTSCVGSRRTRTPRPALLARSRSCAACPHP